MPSPLPPGTRDEPGVAAPGSSLVYVRHGDSLGDGGTTFC
jgi:hypothetical protein